MFKDKIKSIADQTRGLLATANSIRKTAADGKRDLTDEEMSQLEKITAEVKTLNEQRKRLQAGQSSFDVLDEAAQSLDEVQPRVVAGGQEAIAPHVQDARHAHWASRIAIPTNQSFSGGRLVAFHGPTAKQEAYAFGQWFLGAVIGNKSAAKWCADNGIPIQAALTGSDNATGGALVPYQFMSAIIDLTEEYGVFRRWAEPVPMTTDVQGWPRVTGGMTSYFVGDNQAPTESNPTFDNIDLVARELAAYAAIPAALAEDSVINLGDLVARKIALAFATKEDQCGFIGTGTSTYGGIQGAVSKINDGNHAGSIVTAATGNTSWDTLDLADFTNMVGKLPMYAGIQPAWFVSKAAWAASMLRLELAMYGNSSQTLVNGLPFSAFLGYPVVFSDVLNKTLTTQTSTALCLFGDLRMAAMFGTRRAITIAAGGGGDFFTKRQTVILGSERFAINVHECGDSSNPGPLLLLKTPGS